MSWLKWAQRYLERRTVANKAVRPPGQSLLLFIAPSPFSVPININRKSPGTSAIASAANDNNRVLPACLMRMGGARTDTIWKLAKRM